MQSSSNMQNLIVKYSIDIAGSYSKNTQKAFQCWRETWWEKTSTHLQKKFMPITYTTKLVLNSYICLYIYIWTKGDKNLEKTWKREMKMKKQQKKTDPWEEDKTGNIKYLFQTLIQIVMLIYLTIFTEHLLFIRLWFVVVNCVVIKHPPIQKIYLIPALWSLFEIMLHHTKNTI